jgi:hypothetical protein
MTNRFDRRAFVKLAGLGSAGVVFASALPGAVSAQASRAAGSRARSDDFFFLQLSDTHWGFEGPPNPDAKGTLEKAVRSINALEHRPDFIVLTGDLTHTTDDPNERRKRMQQFRQIVGGLDVKDLRFMPGEHDASLDGGISDPHGAIGDEQLAWLEKDLARQKTDAPIVVFTHRPLFDLAPEWDWATPDGARTVDLLMPHRNVSVFYGHIHQEHHHMTGHIAHHAAESLMFPLPAPLSQPKRTPLPWDPAEPYKGLGFRDVEADGATAAYAITEHPVVTKG